MAPPPLARGTPPCAPDSPNLPAWRAPISPPQDAIRQRTASLTAPAIVAAYQDQTGPRELAESDAAAEPEKTVWGSREFFRAPASQSLVGLSGLRHHDDLPGVTMTHERMPAPASGTGPLAHTARESAAREGAREATQLSAFTMTGTSESRAAPRLTARSQLRRRPQPDGGLPLTRDNAATPPFSIRYEGRFGGTGAPSARLSAFRGCNHG
jgi:hypothetical protein